MKERMTCMKRFLFSVMLTLMLASLLVLPFSSVLAQSDYDWAIMVYLCGSDLESEGGMATGDLYEMLAAQTGSRACFIVETGGAMEWQADIEAGDLERYIIQSGEGAYIESVSGASMGKASTLSAFVRWAMSAVPAKHYGLVMWNHGSGSINGVCFDELYDSDSLTLDELTDALHDIPRLDFIGFDACLMGTYETAAQLSAHADYLIASEETEPGSGWDYTAIGTALGRGVSTQELGKVICDSFYSACAQEGEEDMCTLSVIDLGKLDKVTRALDTAAAAMTGLLSRSDTVGKLSQGITRAENYGGNNNAEGYTNMVDLGDMMKRISASVPEAQNCLNALRDAVVYEVHGSRRANANGLSIYYPLSVQGSQEMKVFESLNPSTGYVSFVKGMLYGSVTGEAESFSSYEEEEDDFFGSWDSFWDAFQYGDTDYAARITFAQAPYIDDEGWYVFALDEDCLDCVQSVHMNLYQYLDDDDTLYYLGEDTNVNADWETGEFWDNFDGTWPSLPDNQELMFYILEEEDEYTLYSSPILLNGREMYLRFAWVWEDPDDPENDYGEYVVIDVWDGISATGASGRGTVQIRPGDVITPIYYGFGTDDGDFEEYLGDDYRVRSNFTIEDRLLREGEYDYAFEIIDIWNNSVTTDTVTFYIDEHGDIDIDY